MQIHKCIQASFRRLRRVVTRVIIYQGKVRFTVRTGSGEKTILLNAQKLLQIVYLLEPPREEAVVFFLPSPKLPKKEGFE